MLRVDPVDQLEVLEGTGTLKHRTINLNKSLIYCSFGEFKCLSLSIKLEESFYCLVGLSSS